MSWQKSMPFSKCSNLEAKTIVLFKLCHQRDKRWNCNLHQTKFRKQSFSDGFLHLKINIQAKFKLKTNLTKTKI